MTIQAVIVPKWGLSMEEGELLQWNISPGDEITIGQEIAEIETSKIAGPLEAAVAGKVQRLIAEEGKVLPVGALMAVLADDSDTDQAIEAFIAEFEVEQPSDDTETNTGPELLTVSVGEQTISYLEINPAEVESLSEPVILIHGFGGDSNNWLFNQGKIAETHRVIALDLPGHGRSSKQIQDGSIKGLATVIDGFLSTLGIKKAHLIGHSMGAAIALQCAINSPSAISSVTLICPALVGRDVNPDYISGFQLGRTRKQMKPVLKLLFSDQTLVTNELVDDILKYKRLDGVSEALNTIATSSLMTTELICDVDTIAALPMPLSVIWGDDDKIIHGTQSSLLTADKVTEYQIEKAGHMPHMENASAVNEILLSNLS